MELVYVVQINSIGVNGNIIHWAECAYTDKQKAYDRCDEVNRSVNNDPNEMAYVVGPIPLC